MKKEEIQFQGQKTVLTLDGLRAAIEQTKPIVYYTIGYHVQPGKVLRVGPVDIYPEVWHFHPQDFAEHGARMTRHCRLVDFHTWQPTQDQIALWHPDRSKSIR